MPYDVNITPFTKPSNWNELALYEKIYVYGKNLTKDHAKYADKLQAKQIVKDLLGDNISVAKVVRVLHSWRDLQPEDLNPNHMLKSTHASGWNININVSTNVIQSMYQLRAWNCLFRPFDELQYSFIEPRFFIEEKIHDPVTGNGGQCLVYMFRYIHGTCISIGVGLGIDSKCNHFDADWNLILEPEIPLDIPKPSKLHEMLDMSSTLAQGFEFVRIDMFIDNKDKVYFSEFTFTPKAGKPIFPLHLEQEYGKLWT